MSREEALLRKIEREKKARKEAEELLEKKSAELFEANERLKSTNANLEQRITDRTLELAKAVAMAEQASQAKSQFLANMSHEIRTPLNGMLGFVDILKKTDLTEKQRGHLNTVAHSGELLLTIINDILEFSRIEAGHLDIDKKSFDLRSCVEGIVEVLALKAYEKDLEVPIYISGDVAKNIVSDEGRIRQVLLNLIGNAIKFTHFGEISIRVHVVDESIRFEVTDTGVGIPKDKQEKIFEAFGQTDISDTRKYGGTGLGLTISKKIIAAMEGTICLTSEEGKGSSFVFSLPYQPDGPAPSQQLGKQTAICLLIANKTISSNLSHRFKRWGADIKSFSSVAGLLENFPEDESFLLIDDEFFTRSCENQCAELLDKAKRLKVGVISRNGEMGELNGIGSLTYFDKPLKREQLWDWINETSKEAENEETDSTTENVSSSGRRILLVEDNPINQQLAEVVLEVGGYEVVIAGDGKEGVEKFSSEGPFDLVLMDCQMPVMDGFEATRKIHEVSPETPIIAMTANAFRSTQEQCIEAGMNGFITKPVKDEVLYEHLEKHLKAS